MTMTVLLVALTLAVAVAVELVLRGRKKQAAKASNVVTEYPSTFDVFDTYFHPGHTWVEVSDPRRITAGIDDFSSRIIGLVEEIQLPSVGQLVRQGDDFVVLRRGIRRLSHVAPISGRVVAINKSLQKNPRLINTAPLERGWVAKIEPTNLGADLRNLLKGFAADGWRDAVRSQLIQLLSPAPPLVLQDGGQLVDNIGEWLSDEQWNRIVHQFYPHLTYFQPQNKPQN